MNIFCAIGLHRHKPVKTFDSQERTLKYWVTSIVGYQCKCGHRRIKRQDEGQSPAATQEAFDWLNHRPKRAEVLRLVK